MGKSKELNLIDDILAICRPNNKGDNIIEPHIFLNKKGEESKIVIIGYEAEDKYDDSIRQLYSFEKDIQDTLLYETFEEKIKSLIIDLKTDKKTSCSQSDYSNCISELKEPKVEEYEIIYEFFGAKMKHKLIQFGEFTIYNAYKFYEPLFSKYQVLKVGLFSI